MSAPLTYADLAAACRPGGASVLTSVTELVPAAGPHAAIAPPRYVKNKSTVYAYGTRFVDGEAKRTVLLDGKASSLNRMEYGLSLAISDEHPVLSRLPRVQVTYRDLGVFTDLELPHRVFDGHVRAGHSEGVPVVRDPRYVALRDCTPANAMPLLMVSPVSIAFGAWDATRKTHQVRFPSAIRGEVIGVLADQELRDPAGQRGGARKDDIAPSVQLEPAQLSVLLAAQKDELSPGLVKEIEDNIKNAKKGARLSGSAIGLGAIPPILETLGLVSCSQIIRSHVLSFATLRQLRFNAGPDGDVACRALLAALALNGMARADSELNLRADCDLREASEAEVVLDQRYGKVSRLTPIDIDTADGLLEEALSVAEETAGVDWHGQVFAVEGNPMVSGNASADADDESN